MRTIGKNYYQRIIPIARRGYQEYMVKGTRIPVWRIMKHLSEGMDEKALLQKYPKLTKEDLKACFAYVLELIEGEERSTLCDIPF